MGGCIGCIENDKYKPDILKRYQQFQDVEPQLNNEYPQRLSKREISVTLQYQNIRNKYPQTLPSPSQNQQYIQQILKKLQQETSDKASLLKEIDKIINKFYKNEINIDEQDAAYLSTIMMNFYIQNNQNNKQVVKRYYRYAQTFYRKYKQTYFQQRITLYNNLAGYYATSPQRSKKQEGLKYFKKTVKQIQKYMSKNDYRLILVYNNIGCLLCELKKYKDGFVYFKQCLQLYGVDQQQIQSISKNMKFYAIQYQKYKYMTNNDNITQNVSNIKDQNNKSTLGRSVESFDSIN